MRAAGLGDVTPYAGRYYISFPPIPALLMAPFIALLGPRFSDVLFARAMGAANVGLGYLLVRRFSFPGFACAGLRLGRCEAVLVALLLGFGTVHFYAAVWGSVHYVAHVVAVTFLLLYLLECAGRGRPLVAGMAVAGALMARAPTAFALMFWIFLYVGGRRSPPDAARLRLTPGGALAAAAVLGIALSNALAPVLPFVESELALKTLLAATAACWTALIVTAAAGAVLGEASRVQLWPMDQDRTVALTDIRLQPSPTLWGLLAFCAPVAIATLLLLAQNVVRFGSPLDFGYLNMIVSPALSADLLRYGQFNAHFVKRNLNALLFNDPMVSLAELQRWSGLLSDFPRMLRSFAVSEAERGFPFPFQFNPQGTGIWMVSPALLFAWRVPHPPHRLLFLAAWIGVLGVSAPNLFYYNTGWYQFGYRFALDFVPLLLVLTALGLQRPLYWTWRGLFVLLVSTSVLSNLLGVRWFLGLPPF